MQSANRPTPYPGSIPIGPLDADVCGSWVTLDSDTFYRIPNIDRMNPFFMSIVSASDHWLFICSNGGLTAGRRNSDNALFPYYTEDKLQDNVNNTGSRTLVWVEKEGKEFLWEPFNKALRPLYDTTANLYKNIVGNKLVFEEINHDLNLVVRYSWTTSDKFGFVKQTEVANTGAKSITLNILDGIENILPWGAVEFFQNHYSCLGDAYKQNELDSESGLGIYAFTSIPGDSAEPAESLRATLCWSTCPATATRLLSSTQIEVFRQGGEIQTENRVCGRRGAYFVNNVLTVAAGKHVQWQIVAEVDSDHVEIAQLQRNLAVISDPGQMVRDDVDISTRNLERIVASADGLQLTGDPLSSAHHFSNVLFNVMRGGLFETSYRIPVGDLKEFVRSSNREVFARNETFLDGLGDDIEVSELLERARSRDDRHIVRLVREYLPLSFSRRHGDPSRPWNKFSINVRNRDGRRILDYQGNWRDIFQNWEALCHSYPEYLENVICKFVNSTTADGYNPYRITKNGYEWETPNPDEPWANIGYWGDHQLVYLLKLLEISRDFHPGRLERLLTEDIFVYADVPYDIKPYEDLLRDPRKSITYNTGRERKIEAREMSLGFDGKYVVDRTGDICRTNLGEKLLVPLLAKVSNFIPGAGFWMNTQRPEWNDANNALAGYGVSVVTLCYARRYVAFLRELLAKSGIEELSFNAEVGDWLEAVRNGLRENSSMLSASEITDSDRKLLLDRLGAAASQHRTAIYENDFCGRISVVPVDDLLVFLTLVLRYFDQTIAINKRDDGLYHAYNVMSVSADGISVGHLQEMLEGQVAVLNSGCLDADQCVAVLHALRNSRMYRQDQHSYTLYPDKKLPSFFEKNTMTPEQAGRSGLIRKLCTDGNKDLVLRDVEGNYHFNSSFQNIRDVEAALDRLSGKGYGLLVDRETELIFEIFESVFHHREFTGRSDTFYGYEGLGCIYWHMVSKLLFVAQENCLAATGVHDRASSQLADAYCDIRAGLGFNKSPEDFGAFPTDPYSHTPAYAGAKQPGMTGQVKEEILTRWVELGLVIRDGLIRFHPVLLREREFLQRPADFEYFDVSGKARTIALDEGSFAFTACQTVFVVHRSGEERLVVNFSDGECRLIDGIVLDADLSCEVFGRTGKISRIDVFLSPG